MLHKQTAYKYETPCTVPIVITRCFVNAVEILQYGVIKITHNILHIKSYKYDRNVEDINTKNMSEDVNIGITSYIILS